MSIKKNGGIFGRNPTFNDVEIEGDLNVEGTFSIGGEPLTGLDYEGTWDASTGNPPSASPITGQFWIVSVAGSTDLSGITNWAVGDWVLYNGSGWNRLEGGADGNFVELTSTSTTVLDGTTIPTSKTLVTTDDIGTIASQDADSVNIDGGAIDGVTLGTNSPVTNAEINTILIESDGNDLKFYRTDPTINANNGIGFIDFGGSDDGDFPRAAYIVGSSGDDNWGAGITPTKIIFGTCSRFNSTPRDVAIMTQEGNLSLPIGNLILSDGKGIDFSATAGTGTSELFDDYEEGTWTPEYTTSNGDYASVSYVFQLGSYRKIGSLVFITLSLRTSAVDKTGATGFLHIKNLPFTPAAQNQGSASMSVSYSTIFNSIRPMGAYIKNNETLMYLTYISNPIGSNWSELGAGELSTANPANIVVLSGCYIAA